MSASALAALEAQAAQVVLRHPLAEMAASVASLAHLILIHRQQRHLS
jgi:hypothetical protein